MVHHSCKRCFHKWLARKESGKPHYCPKCKSPLWNKPRMRKR